MKLILASASPRRAEILRNAGFEFTVDPAHIDESWLPGERAEDYVRRLATTKGRVAADRVADKAGASIVIGADTAVLVEGEILGKPEGVDDARRMLRLLSGKKHEVLSGVSVIMAPSGLAHGGVERTSVFFRELTERDIDEYIATGEPFDKAGGYGIQGAGGRFVERIEGCYFNVMGLPLARVRSILEQLQGTAAASPDSMPTRRP